MELETLELKPALFYLELFLLKDDLFSKKVWALESSCLVVILMQGNLLLATAIEMK